MASFRAIHSGVLSGRQWMRPKMEPLLNWHSTNERPISKETKIEHKTPQQNLTH